MSAALTWTAIIFIALWALDRLFLWFEAKGWIYWRKSKDRPRSGVMRAFVPYLVEEAQRANEFEEDQDSGDGSDTKGSKRPGADDPRHPPAGISDTAPELPPQSVGKLPPKN